MLRLLLGALGACGAIAAMSASPAQAQWYVSGSLGGNQVASQSGTVAVPTSGIGGGIVNSGEISAGLQVDNVTTFGATAPASAGFTGGASGLPAVAATSGLASPAFTNVPLKIDFGIGISGNVAVGYRLPWNFRVEVEGGYTHSSVDKLTVAGVSIPNSSGNVDIWTGAVNAFYDIPTGTNFIPYLGGGLGAANERVSSVTIAGTNFGGSSSSTHLLWQAEAGIGYQLSPKFIIRPAYRFQQIQDGNPNTQIHVFKVGLQYTFN